MFVRNRSLVALMMGCLLLFTGAVTWAASPVNINTADASTIAKELAGIGLKRAQAIIDYRQKHGPFKAADELALVKGIGPAVISKNRELIRVDAKPVAKAPEKEAK